MANQALDHKQSVKHGEFGKGNGAGGVLVYWVPYSPDNSPALPPVLPDPPAFPQYGLWPNDRDRVLMSTVYFESMWAGTVGIEASKFAASGWELESNTPRKQALVQEWLLNSSVGGLAGWGALASA